MKKIILTLVLSLFQIGLSYSQCCPYLGTMEIIPANPTELENVYLITDVTTPNQGTYFGYEVFHDSNDSIRVEACYWEGFLTATKQFIDTINLGMMSPGTYSLKFIAYSSNDYNICVHTDSNSVQLEFEVSGVNSINKVSRGLEISCFPNPVSNENISIQSNHTIKEVKLINAIGSKMFYTSDLNANSLEINMNDFPSGMYFIKVKSRNNLEVVKKVLKL